MKKFAKFLTVLSFAGLLSSCSLFSSFLDIDSEGEGEGGGSVVVNIANTDPSLNSGFIARTGSGSYEAVATNEDEFVQIINIALCKKIKTLNIQVEFDNQYTLEDIEYDLMAASYCYGVNEDNCVYSTGSGQQKIEFYYGDYSNLKVSDIATVFSTQTKTYTEYKNANFENRLYKFRNSKRPDDFEDFPINNATETMDVYNSEDLWFAVSEGFRPEFKISGNCKAKAMYGRALAICKEYISDEMTDFEKYQTLFDYVVYNTNYDYDALEFDDISAKNTCFHLEGTMEYNRAVCDGLSKLYALLCGIEGLPVRKASGFPDGSYSGHAWNYIKFAGAWYLACPTWAQADISDGSYTYMDYSAFATESDYFYEVSNHNADYNFVQKAYPETLLNTDQYVDITFENFLEEGDYDYQLDSNDELRQLLLTSRERCGKTPFTITVLNEDNAVNIRNVFNSTSLASEGATLTISHKTENWAHDYTTLIIKY